MSLLRRTRTEMAGAWRSLRYDLGRTPTPPPPAGPDVTSTGMSTWGLDGLVEQARPDPAPPAGRPRRAVAMTAFGVLTVAGAAGAYLAVVNGLGSLVSEPVAADTLPPRVAVTSDVGMGPPTTRPVTPTRATVVVPRKTTAAAVPPPPGPDPLPSAAAPPPRPAAAAKSPIRTTKATSPECQCRPPVPTPTAPTSSPSPTPSPSPSESPSAGAEPSPSESADDPGSPSPSRSGDGRRHRRHH